MHVYIQPLLQLNIHRLKPRPLWPGEPPSMPWKTRGGHSGHGHTHLDCLLPDGRVGVQEAMNNMGKDLGVDCRLIKVLDELLHLWPRVRCENTDGPSNPQCRTPLALVFQRH